MFKATRHSPCVLPQVEGLRVARNEQPQDPFDSEESKCAPRFDDPHDEIEAQIVTGGPQPEEETTDIRRVNTAGQHRGRK